MTNISVFWHNVLVSTIVPDSRRHVNILTTIASEPQLIKSCIDTITPCNLQLLMS